MKEIIKLRSCMKKNFSCITPSDCKRVIETMLRQGAAILKAKRKIDILVRNLYIEPSKMF